jgi:hypothetical protein
VLRAAVTVALILASAQVSTDHLVDDLREVLLARRCALGHQPDDLVVDLGLERLER